MKIVLCSLFLAALSYRYGVPILLLLPGNQLTVCFRVDAKLHNSAVCVTGRTEAPIGGTGWSVSYNWQKNYEIDLKATECACGYYKQRNTGDNQWDKCEDCTYVRSYLLRNLTSLLTIILGRTSVQLSWLAHWW